MHRVWRTHRTKRMLKKKVNNQFGYRVIDFEKMLFKDSKIKYKTK